jgi:hypothetical protein
MLSLNSSCWGLPDCHSFMRIDIAVAADPFAVAAAPVVVNLDMLRDRCLIHLLIDRYILMSAARPVIDPPGNLLPAFRCIQRAFFGQM